MLTFLLQIAKKHERLHAKFGGVWAENEGGIVN
jgi:hypothetical protein